MPDTTFNDAADRAGRNRLADAFDTWRTRDLSQLAIDYLFVDALHFRVHDGARSESGPGAYGITTEGTSVLLHLDGANAGSSDACIDFLEDMIAQGLGSQGPTITDGAPGPCAAIDQAFDRARRQRCLIHRARNCPAEVYGGGRSRPVHLSNAVD